MPTYYDLDLWVANSAGAAGNLGKVRFDCTALPDGQDIALKVPNPGGGLLYTGTIPLLEMANVWLNDQTMGGGTVLTLDGTEGVLFDDGGSAFAGRVQLATVLTANRSYGLPDITGTVLLDAGAQTITGVKTFGETFFDGDAGVTSFKANDPSTAPLLRLLDDTTGFGLDVVTTGAIAGDGTLLIPSGGGRVVTTGTPVAGRIPFYSGTSGLVVNDADLSFATDTLTVTKIAAHTVSGLLTMADAINVALNTTTGTKIGTGTTQKLGFWNAAPIVQPASANQAALALDTDVTGVDLVDRAAINSNFSAVQTLVNQLRTDLVAAGLIKGSA